ncbi:MAG: HlyD family efflux transporter periplasmic adaptor subunit [Bacteroidota bacterium]
MDRVIKKKKWPPSKIALYVGVPLAAVILLGLMFRGAGKKVYKTPKERLSIATVKQDVFQEFIPIPGNVMAIQTIYIDAFEGGQVKELYMEGGEMVKKGDLILKLSNPSLELNYMNVTTSLLEQMNNLRNSLITLEETGLNLRDQLLVVKNQIDNLGQIHRRNEQLFKDGVIPEAEYLETKYNYEFNLERKDLLRLRIHKDSVLKDQQAGQIRSSMRLVNQSLAAIQRNIANLSITAPANGQLSSIRVQIGETVSSGQNLGRIDILDGGFKVRARIDEHYNGRVEQGQKAEFVFQGEKYRLMIRKVYPEVTEGNFEVDMDFIDGDGPAEIKRGQNLQIRLALSDEREAVLIPRGGFYHASGGQYIFVVSEDGTRAIRRENIEIGRQSDRYYEVRRGLEPGEKVIVSNYDSFKEVDELILIEN